MEMKGNRLIVVLGMHRSGTSAITRGLQVLGVDIGSRMMPAVEGDNVKGYWEDIDLNALNIEMLNAIGGDWHQVSALSRDDFVALRERGYLLRAVDLLREKVCNIPIFGFKDPRVAKLLPFWKAVFDHCQFNVAYVVAIRNPLSVAKSLAKRGGIDAEKSYLMWLGHVIVSIAETVGVMRALVDYDRLMENPDDELNRLSRQLGLEVDHVKLQEYRNEFIDHGLRHSLYTLNDLSLESACPPVVNEMYAELLKVAADKTTLDNVMLLKKMGDWSTEFERLKSPLILVDRLAKETAARDRQIANLSQAMAARDRRIANLSQAMAARDRQIANLSQAMAARDRQIANLSQILQADQNSPSWTVTNPLRKIGNGIKRLRAYFRFAKLIITTFGLGGLTQKSTKVLKNEGYMGLLCRVQSIVAYYKANGQISAVSSPTENLDSADVIQRIQNEGPKMSVIISLYKTPLEMLKQAIESITKQTYKNWELILVDDFSERDDITKLCLAYQERDVRIKYVPRTENGNISAANNTGLQHATGNFYTILDHDDTLTLDALYEAAKIVIHHPDVDYIYSDEDKVTKDGLRYFGPFFKPDWSPEYMLAMMYTCHMSVFRTCLVMSLGAYNSDFDGAQDYELVLRVVRHSNNIQHIAKVLYHWRVWENSTAQSMDAKPFAHMLARRALELHLKELDEKFAISEAVVPGHHFVDFFPKGNPLISIVIPTANCSMEIKGSIEKHINAVCESILAKTSYYNFEIIVVHNGNLSDDQIEWLNAQTNIVLTHYTSAQFSLSEKINQGAELANGEYLVIMNDDIRVISEDWLTLMLGMVQRDGVGAVGPKLLFPDETIQHAGVVMLGGLPGHPYYQDPKDSLGYGLGLQVNRNYLAVTGACCITPKSIFDQLGGYSNRYPLNYNDVDYCLRLHALGLRSVYVANSLLYHYEGVSRDGGRTVATEEIQKFLDDWGTKYKNDPFYNVNLNQCRPYT
ncbi:MAG: glycosyltransferase [Acidiferrobacter sp.]